MLNKKIIKILAFALCGITMFSLLTGCSKKGTVVEADPNATISNTTNTETESKEETKEEIREVHDMAYYLGLQGTDTSLNFKYQGTYILDDEIKDKNLSFRQLLEQNEDLSISKNNTVDPHTAISVRYKKLDRNITLSFKNDTDVPVALTATKIGSITYKTNSATYLYGLIGEQAKVINKDISFLDSAIDVFGTPVEVKDMGENTVKIVYGYDEYVITIICNLDTQEGTFEITFA